MQETPVTILVVEDNQAHSTLIERNLRRSGIENVIVKLENGKQAIDYIYAQGDFLAKKPPCSLLMLLDLNMPVMGGIEVLKKLKNDNITKMIPIVVLTTTDSQEEIKQCYELGCNLYITKPIDPRELANVLSNVGMLIQVISYPSLSQDCINNQQ